MPSTLSSLAFLINRSIITLEKACSESKLPFPGFDEPFTPASEAFRANPEAEEAAKVIAAAAHQLMMMVLPPSVALYTVVSGAHKSAALRVCLEANVTEILREGGKEGMHVKEIAERTKVNHQKLARCLRYLATHHVYKEVSPDVFTNNRVSSMMDTGKAVDDLIARPEEKHENTPGLAAVASHHLDEVYKAAGYLWESMSDPATAHSFESNETPFNLGFSVNTSFFETIALPDPRWQLRQRRFNVGMKGVTVLESADAVLKAFDWQSLPKDSVVVDVGGGIGSSSLILAKNLPDIKIVIQDTPIVLTEGATQFWARELPEALASGRVSFQVHDFFTPQPIKNASVFLLKQIMHDWPDKYAIKILSQLRQAARPDTRLIIIESAIPFACHDPSGDKGKGVIGAVPKEAPEPLLANYGVANELTYTADVTMLILTNAQERTVKDMKELLHSTGWQMTKIVRDHETGSFMQPVEAVPMVKIPVRDTAE
ncbi:4-O-methyltransferase 1 [Psilocybe cubensis]|uniref:4-O-methyltransferase 1 n=2 Tax=Psilocybe cubensis TaxID=181762 RepID=A0ACB8HAR1_PSICU|nr:4-O-methyltransferase 1 [Psilocybe cubensis]KAH9484888.1 4-O-methyltransferase 1 [Psilocybe cubensis]